MQSIMGLLGVSLNILGPAFIRKIYLITANSNPIVLKTDPSYVWLTILVSFSMLSVLVTMPNFIFSGPPVFILIIAMIGVIMATMMLTSILLVFGVSLESISSLCRDQSCREPTEESLTMIVKHYAAIESTMQPYLFLGYSISVVNLTINLYTCTMAFTGCKQESILRVITFNATVGISHHIIPFPWRINIFLDIYIYHNITSFSKPKQCISNFRNAKDFIDTVLYFLL